MLPFVWGQRFVTAAGCCFFRLQVELISDPKKKQKHSSSPTRIDQLKHHKEKKRPNTCTLLLIDSATVCQLILILLTFYEVLKDILATNPNLSGFPRLGEDM